MAPANSALQKNAKDMIQRLTAAPKQVPSSAPVPALPTPSGNLSNIVLPQSSPSLLSSGDPQIPRTSITSVRNRHPVVINGNRYLGQVTQRAGMKRSVAMEVDEEKSTPAPSGSDTLGTASIKQEDANDGKREAKRPRRQ